MSRLQSKGSISIGVLLLILVSWLSVVDSETEDYIDRSLITALSSFGLARAINAGISVAQSVETGVGIASVAPLQSLDPLNDLAEDFSSVMKLSIGALVVLKLLVEVTSSLVFKVLFTLFGLGLVAGLYWNKRWVNLLAKGFFLAGFVRFSFVVVVFLVALVSEAFIGEKTEEEASQVASFASQVEAYSEREQQTAEQEAEQNGWLSGLSAKFNAMKDLVSIERIQQSAEDAISSMLKLMALFVFKTILLPIGFLYLLLKLVSPLWRIDAGGLFKRSSGQERER